MGMDLTIYIVFVGLILLFSIISNILVIVCIAKHTKLRSVCNLLICNLAVSDILLSGVFIPQKLHDVSHPDNYHEGEVACKFIHFFPIFFISCSCFTQVCISFERRRALLAFTKVQLTVSQVVKIIPVIWIGSFLVSLPSMMENSISQVVQTINGTHTTSVVGRCGNLLFNRTLVLANCFFVTLCCFVIPLMWMFINYSKLISFVNDRCKRVDVSAITEYPESRTGTRGKAPVIRGHLCKNRFRLIKMFVLMASSFTVWWTPFFVLFVYAKISEQDESQYSSGIVNLLINLLAAFSGASNAILYVVFNTPLRQACKKMFSQLLPSQK